MGKRAWQYPEATGITNEDVILLDSPTGGSRSIKANKIGSVLINKTITERGTFDAADDNADGYKKVTVDVPYTDVEVASGPIASWDDGEDLPLKSLTCFITPVQDLHGYDAPWAGGAGKNKFPIATASSSGAQNIFSSQSISLKANTNYILSFDTSNPITKTMSVSFNAGSTQVRGVDIPAGTSVVGISFTQNVDNLNWYVREAVNISNIMIEEGGAKTDFAPYSNICPISGWDEVNATVVGKNIFGGLPLANAIVNAGGTLDTVNKTVSFTHGNSQVNILENIKLKDNTKYTFILTYSNAGNNNSLSLFYKTSGSRYPINLNNSSDTKTTIVYTTSAVTIDKLVLGWVLDANTNIYYEESGLFEGELTASDFEPYNGQTYTIDLDGTRYGGTLDVVSGELTIDRAYVDMGSLYWNYSSGAKLFTAPVQGIKSGTYTDTNLLSSIYPVKPMSYSQFDYGMRYNSATAIGVKNPLYTDATAFKTAMSGVQLVYELETPLTVQLTPTQVKSLVGENNIYSDTGDVDVEYQKIWVRPSA